MSTRSRADAAGLLLTALCWLLIGAGAAQAAASGGPHFATGMVPLDHATYAKLPSVRRHRGFYKPEVDLTARYPQPADQGAQGSCAAWATTYAARAFLLSEDLGRRPSSAAELPSPEYVFGRVRGARPECMSGIGMLDALQVLTNEGVVSLQDYPYGGKTCVLSPPASLKEKASTLRIGGWRAVQRKVPNDWRTPIVMDDVKAQLSQGYPVVFSMPASPEFMALKATPDVYSTQSTEGPWHALAIVGYDEQKQAVRIMNSWGRSWGQGGYAWISYDTFQRLAGEAYVLLPVGGGQPVSADTFTPAKAPIDPISAIQAKLQNTDCASLQLQTVGGRRTVTGFFGLPAPFEKTKQAIYAIDPSLVWNVQANPWPQCEAQIILANSIVDSPVRLRLADETGRSIEGAPKALKKDQFFSVDVETNTSRPFVHVIYIQADGSAVELYRGAPATAGDGRRRVVLGAAGKVSARYKVGAPLGDEMIIAVASTSPVFGDEIGAQATEREFLTLLRAKMIDAVQHQRGVSANILRIHTSEN